MKFLPVLKWMVFISLIVTVVAGGAVWHVWNNSDRLVSQEILKRFDEVAPDLQLILGSTTLHGARGATLRDLEVRDRATQRPLFRAKQLEVDLDSQRLLEHHQVAIDRVRLTSADILLTREENGYWNWQQYRFVPPAKQSPQLPVVVLEDLRIQLTLKHGQGIPAARLLLTAPEMQAVPASSHGYDFDGAIDLPGAGLLKMGGMCDMNTANWELEGRMRDVRADHQLLDLAQSTNPNLQTQLTQLDSAIEQALPHLPKPEIRTAGAALSIGNNSQFAPQFVGVLDVDFRVASNAETRIPQFQLKVDIREGRMMSPAIPVQLTDVTARLYKDNQTLEFKLEDAVGEGCHLSGDVLISSAPDSPPPAANFRIEKFPVSSRLSPLLPPRIRRIFDSFQPEGSMSGRGQFVMQPDGRWTPVNLFAEIHEGTTTHDKFRYPVTRLKGTIQQRVAAAAAETRNGPQLAADDLLLDITAEGLAGTRPVNITGWLKNPGPEAETRFEVRVTDFPLDSAFRNALEAKPQSVVESMNLTGRADAVLVFYRPPGRDRITQPFFDVQLSAGKMRFDRFPYDITDLHGHLTFRGPEKLWTFHELRGRHGDGQLTGTGRFDGAPAPGVLELTVRAKNAALDADLYNALSRPQRSLWNMIDPDGFCDLTTEIFWTASPGQPAIVTFPEREPVRVFNTRIRPRPFPFDMLIQEATFSFDPNDPRHAGVQHAEIHSFRAVHDAAPISATGWVEAKPDGEWQVHLNQLNASGIVPDGHLRAALPASWHDTLKRIDESGSLSIENSEMDFRGDLSGQRNTTARWNLNMRFTDCKCDTGLEVSHIYGLVTADGLWDGFALQNSGVIQIETAEVLEMPLTSIQGPYSLNNEELVLGSRQVFQDDSQLNQVDRNSRIKAQAYGGELVLDALVETREDGRYQFFTELQNARLESYAALHIPEQQNLRGVVSAWMSLGGRGDDPADMTGKGQLRISPAALYELPVMVKLIGAISQLNLNVQNLTAFDYALMSFSVRDRAFWLDPVDLVGESISFRGKGSVGFGGAVNLDFYSRPARSRAMSIPLINQLFTTWTKVEVTGTTDRPQVRSLPMGQLDENLKQFLQPFNPNPNGPIPVLAVPRVFQPSQPLLPSRRSTGHPAAGPRASR